MYRTGVYPLYLLHLNDRGACDVGQRKNEVGEGDILFVKILNLSR